LYLLRTARFSGKHANALLAVGAVPYSGSGLKKSAIQRGYAKAGEFWNLPNSGPETDAAMQALPNPSNSSLSGREATETNVKRELAKEFGVIHLAVHAFSSGNPDRSSLVVLSDPARHEDGFIQASEIEQMHLPAKLVVLSACDTDVGPIEGEEGMSSLSNAFLLAGARTVISTLWPVEDEPSLLLMKLFYRHLSQHQAPADAMTAAKREMLKRFGNRALPLYWAGFVVLGSNLPVHYKERMETSANNASSAQQIIQ